MGVRDVPFRTMKKELPQNRIAGKVGFTLVELLVALAILTVLVSVVSVSILSQPGEAKVTAAKAQMRTLKLALSIYKTDTGTFPTQAQGLQALVQKPTVPPIPDQYRSEGYLDSLRVPLDPWKNPYIYLIPGRNGEPFEILSYGSDGEPGGIDNDEDLSSSFL